MVVATSRQPVEAPTMTGSFDARSINLTAMDAPHPAQRRCPPVRSSSFPDNSFKLAIVIVCDSSHNLTLLSYTKIIDEVILPAFDGTKYILYIGDLDVSSSKPVDVVYHLGRISLPEEC